MASGLGQGLRSRGLWRGGAGAAGRPAGPGAGHRHWRGDPRQPPGPAVQGRADQAAGAVRQDAGAGARGQPRRRLPDRPLCPLWRRRSCAGSAHRIVLPDLEGRRIRRADPVAASLEPDRAQQSAGDRDRQPGWRARQPVRTQFHQAVRCPAGTGAACRAGHLAARRRFGTGAFPQLVCQGQRCGTGQGDDHHRRDAGLVRSRAARGPAGSGL